MPNTPHGKSALVRAELGRTEMDVLSTGAPLRYAPATQVHHYRLAYSASVDFSSSRLCRGRPRRQLIGLRHRKSFDSRPPSLGCSPRRSVKTRRPTKISFPSVADHDAITGVRPALGPAASLLRSTLVRGKTPCVRRKSRVLEASENHRLALTFTAPTSGRPRTCVSWR